ncbi:MAG: DUF302 domain-containing protein [Halothiobacillus sp.]|jgi:uncharacterized protein (DUF302 family)|uniref:DUF302 domain-containing protein n=1 Tax=Halothiobacillus sp. TaxID=1891311 RepID=UPI002AD1F28E|nr:DUF302 domain-containing protein [Halothiobacillus sp.]MDA3877074.1 DUF302 domain-containing protein [Halothiobacillus sp.]
MLIEKKSPHDLETTCQRLTDAVKDNGFGVLHIHDIQNTLESKGIPFDAACRVFEVCNPKRAKEVLSVEIGLANALPCRIAVYARKDGIYVSMMSPASILKILSQNQTLAEIAESVEQSMVTMIEQTVAA